MVDYTILYSTQEIISVFLLTGSRKSSTYDREGDVCELYALPNSS